MNNILKPLIALALLLTIPAEIVVLYTKIQEANTLISTAKNAAAQQKAEAEKLHADAQNSIEAAKNAAERQAAEAKIGEQKAETEHQTAINAERRAAADADKMEALAQTAKQNAMNAVLRAKSEALKATAELQKIKGKMGVARKLYSCAPTLKDCATAWERTTENGRYGRIPR